MSAAASPLLRTYAHAFPEAYKEDFGPGRGVNDALVIEQLEPGELSLEIYEPPNGSRRELRLKITRVGPAMSLSRVLPILQSMGVDVVDEYPYEIARALKEPAWILDFGMLLPDCEIADRGDAGRAVRGGVRGRVERPLRGRRLQRPHRERRPAVAAGARAAGLRALHAPDRLDVQPAVHRGGRRRQRRHHATAACGCSRRDSRPAGPTDRQGAEDRIVAQIEEALDHVASLDQDRILRSFLAMILATLRTNYFQVDDDGIDRIVGGVQARPAVHPGPAAAPSRSSRSGCTRPASRACTCGSGRSRAAACAGATGRRTSARRCSAWSRRRRSRTR